MRTAVLAMEDRKRSVPHEPSDDSGPPIKRQALQSSSSSNQQNNHQLPQSQEDVIVSCRPPPSLSLVGRARFKTLPLPPLVTFHLRLTLDQTTKHFQKEAIWRQMMEYKRERNMLEHRVEELEKKSTYHDDHLRVIDAWWSQVRPSFELFPS